MIDRSNKTSQRPADIRSISDPPDMGKLRPAEEVAASLVSAEPVYGMHALLLGPVGARRVLALRDGSDGIAEDAAFLRQELADLIRQSRAEGAAAALEEIADDFNDDIAFVLRARAKSISDPPDMG